MKYKHLELLHPPEEKSYHAKEIQSPAARKVFLRVIPVTVKHGNMETNTYAMLDECSTTTLCSRELSKKLQAVGVKRKLSVATVNKSSSVNAIDIQLHVHELRNPDNYITLDHVLSVDHLPISTDIPIAEDIAGYNHLNDVVIAELPNKDVSLLIGSDYPEAFREISRREGGNNELYAVQTKLGFSVIGLTKGTHERNAAVHYLHYERESLDEKLDKLWNTDFNDLYSEKNAQSPHDKKALDIMNESVTLDKHHYAVKLPWKNDPPRLTNNRTMAAARLQMLRNKLNRQPQLREEYCKIIKSYREKGYIRMAPSVEVPDGESIWYLPHHPVTHPKKKKIRIVYDCAAKYQGQSLNDALLQGPDLTNRLLGVLIRFRKHTIALAADIREMFMQVCLTEDDARSVRFLWYPDDDITQQPIDYELCCHAFGFTSSPSVCSFVLQHTAKQHEHLFHANTVEAVRDNFYVDNLLKSVETIEKAKHIANEPTELLSMGGFDLAKWISNEKEVMASIPERQRAPSIVNLDLHSDVTESTLGIRWKVNTDVFVFTSVINDKAYTRRGILSVTSSFFDPLGFFTPVILTAKLIIQEITKRNLGWDDVVNDDLKRRWKKWLSSLDGIQKIRIARCYQPRAFGKVTRRELHIFCDASSVGYGAAVYMRMIDERGSVHVTFVMGKSRLAPIKPVTIPRLELVQPP